MPLITVIHFSRYKVGNPDRVLSTGAEQMNLHSYYIENQIICLVDYKRKENDKTLFPLDYPMSVVF